MHVCISNVCCNGGTFEFKLKYPLHWGPRRQIGPDQARARARSSQTSQLLVLRLFNSDSAACPRPAAAGSASPGLSALGRAPLILGLCVWRETGDREGEGGGSPAWLCKHLPINQTIKHKASAWQKWYSSDSRHPDTLKLLYGWLYIIWLLGKIFPSFEHPQLHPLFITIIMIPPAVCCYWDVSRHY